MQRCSVIDTSVGRLLPVAATWFRVVVMIYPAHNCQVSMLLLLLLVCASRILLTSS